MDQMLFTLPILPSKTEAARAFLQELGGARKQDFLANDQALGFTKEVWALQQMPQGDFLVAYVTGKDLDHAVGQFNAAQDDFDRWFKQQVLEVTGADFNEPSTGSMFVSQILADIEV